MILIFFLLDVDEFVLILLGNILNGTADLHFNEQLLIWNLENFSIPKISYFLWKKLFDISFAQFLHLNPVFKLYALIALFESTNVYCNIY